jgi:hypothetical protein
VSSSTSSSRRSLLQFAARGLLLCAGLLAIGNLLRPIDTWQDIDVVGEKYRAFIASGGHYSVLFIGSSYIYREVDPAVFDAETAAAGLPTRSFNFGVPGMNPPETYYLLEHLLKDAAPHGPRYVIIELDSYQAIVRERNSRTRRFEYWHGPRQTAEVQRALLQTSVAPGKKAKDLATHGEAAARQLVCAGRGAAWLEVLARELGLLPRSASSLGAGGDGYVPLDEESGYVFDLRAGTLETFDMERFEEKLAALKSGAARDPSTVTPVEIAALRRILEIVRAHGARPVLLVPPAFQPRSELIALREQGVYDDLLVYNDPVKYPDLYDLQYRFDLGHLNAAGAARFSTLLAREFATLMEGG